MADYFIALDGQQQGPFPAHELPSRGMSPESMVWCEGMGDWQRAEQVAELASFLPGRQAAPPVFPQSASQQGYPQQGYPQQGYPQQGYAPQGYVPAPPYNPASSNRVAAGICGILLGALGVHKFILGQNGAGITMLLVSLLSCGILAWVMGIIGLIEGIIYLCKTDAEFHQMYVVQRKAWF